MSANGEPEQHHQHDQAGQDDGIQHRQIDSSNQRASSATSTEKPPPMPRNTVPSVNTRLLRLSGERHEEFQLTLLRYGLERLLYRLRYSPYAGQFVVKGALLFTLWIQVALRAAQVPQTHNPSLTAPHTTSIYSASAHVTCFIVCVGGFPCWVFVSQMDRV